MKKTRKRAFITGITGQDGSYLVELLLEKGYEVHGLIRRSSSFNTGRIEHLFKNPQKKNKQLVIHYGDLSDSSNLARLLKSINPHEIYNLGAQSHVKVSFDVPEYTADVVGLGTLRILEAIRENSLKTRFYQASSSEMYGRVLETPQKETTPFYPRSPYACAKVFGYWITRNYREAYGMYTVNGILFNHESPRRGKTFVTKKITRGLARIKLGLDKKLFLGNLDAKRDWGHAKDYVYGMWLTLQQDSPDDYVLSTGETYSVREFVEKSSKYMGFDLVWKGKGLKEKGIDKKTGKTIIEIDSEYFRPTEVDLLIGDARKARKKLGWKPSMTFTELVENMCEHDLEEEMGNK